MLAAGNTKLSLSCVLSCGKFSRVQSERAIKSLCRCSMNDLEYLQTSAPSSK